MDDNSQEQLEVAHEILEADVSSALYLSSLTIKNFRIFDKEVGQTFSFNKGLNVFVGSNNTGKSAAIDALRYILSLGSYQKRDDYIKLDEQDIYRKNGDELANEETIEFTATFRTEDENILGSLGELYDRKDGQEYVFNLKHEIVFTMDSVLNRHTYRSSGSRGGASFSNPVSQETLDYITSIYLSPLRDIINDGKKLGLEVERLIRSQAKDQAARESLDKLPEKTRSAVVDEMHEATGVDYLKAISNNLSGYGMPYFRKKIDDLIAFSPGSINKYLYRSMLPIFTHEIHGPTGLDLEANGLGLNNLIFASIVLSRSSDERSYKFFLVEEPEAHLHPQIQRTFFNDLNNIENHQIFLTSHSPTIAATVDIDKIILFTRDNNSSKVVHFADAYGTDDEDRQASKRYLKKFFDVTKSQALFANSVIFVEGVTEALLLQKFSELIGRNLLDNGTEVVVLGAKAGFEHFRPMFEASGVRCAFITDDDRKWDAIDDQDNSLPTGDSSIKIFEGVGTFEYELLKTAKKADDQDEERKDRTQKLRDTFKQVSDKGADTFFVDDLNMSYKRMKNKAGATEWAEGLASNSYFKKYKSDFAFYLNENLTEQDVTMIPSYIISAIEHVNPLEENSEEVDERT